MAALLSPGDVCGGNEVVRLLGSGGFAQVYEVRDRAGTRRALKILDADAEAKPKVRARLAQEGAALTLLDHANVVRLYDAGIDDDRIYLLLELVEGKNLRDALRTQARGRPAVETIVRWIRQAAEGVAEAHRRGIVHRDLKPENLLVTPQEVVKVIDFGIAKLTGWGVRTTHEQKLGTALYMSPEQIQGKPPDARMDVYALGLILYELLSGAHPVVPSPASVYQICALQLNHRPPPLAEVVPGIPPELGAVVDRAIEKDPARRLPDMRSFADGLHAALVRIGEPRSSALRSLVDAPNAPARRPLPRTQPMAAVDPSALTGSRSSSPPDRLRATESRGDDDALPFAVTAAVPTGTVDPALSRTINESPPPAPMPPPPVPQGKPASALTAAILLAVLVVAGTAAILLRFAWPF